MVGLTGLLWEMCSSDAIGGNIGYLAPRPIS